MSQDVWKGRRLSTLIGILFICTGGWLSYEIFYQGIMSITANPMGLVFIAGPALFFFGVTALIRGIIWGKKAFSGRNVLYSGLLMFIIGIYPFVYTPYLIGNSQAEAADWLGQFIRISTGYPGILFSIIGFFIRNKNRN